MDICGEHGDEIAYSGRDCPACEQIKELEKGWKDEFDSEVGFLEEEINSMQDKIDDLEHDLSQK